ncbi:MAG: DNA adenine methylase [Dehalococcoidia bacterium]
MYPAHSFYVEPFAGGASCFWAKKPSPRELLNDYDPDVVQAYTVLRDASATQLQTLAGFDWRVSEDTFVQCQQPDPDPLVNTYRFIYRRRASFGARETILARNQVGKILPVAKHLPEQHARLKGVKITQGDGLATIRQQDRPGVFFFVDPPWPGYFKKWEHYTMAEIHKLIDTLRQLKHAQWLWAESPQILEVLGQIPQGWRQQELTHISTGYGGQRKISREVVFTNYD